MRETKLWEKIRPHLLLWGEADRVENAIGSGMSDVFYDIAGKCGWIETKLEKNGLLYFEKFQPNWMAKHVRQGARVFVITMDREETIKIYPAGVILQQPRVPYDKWTTVNVTNVTPSMAMPAPYRSWKSVKEILTS
jgi:hypothetical protein